MKIGKIIILIALTASSYLSPKQLFFENSELAVNCPPQWNYEFIRDTLVMTQDSMVIRINYESDLNQQIDFRVILYYFNRTQDFLSSAFRSSEILSGPSPFEIGNFKGLKTVTHNSARINYLYNLYNDQGDLFTIIATASGQSPPDELPVEQIISEISFTGERSTVETDRYYQHFGGYSVVVPGDWEITADQMILRCRSPLVSKFNNAHPNLIITSTPLNRNYTLENLFQENVHQLNSSLALMQIEEIDQGYDTIGGLKSMWIHYRYNIGDYTMFSTSYILIKDNVSYTLSYHSPADIFPRAKTGCEDIITSFRFESTSGDSNLFSISLEEQDRFTNFQGNYSVIFPLDWELIYLNPEQSSICFISPPENITDSIQENFLINHSNQGIVYSSPSDFFQDYRDSLTENYPGFKILKMDTLIINAHSFIRFTSTIDQNNFSDKFLSYVTVKDSFFYVITFTAGEESFERYLNLAENIMETWRFEDLSPTDNYRGLDENDRYTNHQGRYSIIFPHHWILTNMGEILIAKGVLESLEDEFQENITILSRDSLIGFNSLSEYFDQNLNQLSTQTENFILHQQGNYNIDHHPSKFAIYSYDLFGKEIKFCSIIIYPQPRVYTITFQDYPEDFDRHLPVFYEIMKTLEIF